MLNFIRVYVYNKSDSIHLPEFKLLLYYRKIKQYIKNLQKQINIISKIK